MTEVQGSLPTLVMDEARQAVGEAGGPMARLRRKSYDMLAVLARNAPDCVSKDLLAESVWPGLAATDDSIAQCIRDIRRALGDRRRRLVQTVPGRGYRLLAHALGPGWEAPSDTRPVLAVTAFEALTETTRWRHFARGLTADLIADLTRSGACSVLSPTLIHTPDRLGAVPASDYGRLGARWVIAGTVQCDEQSDPFELRVAVSMVEAADGTVVWSRRWDEPVERFFWVQDRIVSGIVSGLANLWSGRLAALAERGARHLPTTSLGAYEHFQRGVVAAGRFTPEGLAEGVTCFEAALALDPGYGDAWSTLATIYGLLSASASGAELDALVEARLDASRRSFAHRPRRSWAFLSGAWVAARDGDAESARALIREAVVDAPNDADLLCAAACYAALNTELYDEAEAWGTQALALNVRAPDWYHFPIGYARFFRGDPAGALASLRRGPQTYAELLAYRAACEIQLGRGADAAATARQLTALHPGFSTAAYIASEAFLPETKVARIVSAFHAAGLPR